MGAGALDTYVLYTRRWYILFVYSLAVICQNAFWNTFGAIEPYAIIYYNTSKQMINFLSALGPIIFIPFSFVAVWYIDRFGLRKSVLTTTILCGSGALIRCIFIPHFQYNIIFPIIGQTLNNIAGPFSMILQPKLSSVWFAPSERTVATSIGFQANTIGLSGCFLISMFVKHQSDVPLLLYAYAVAGIVATVLALIYFPEKPPSPPSFTGEKSTAHEENSPSSVLKNSWACLKTRWAASLLIIFGSCPGGVYSAWGALLVNTITDLGYNNDQAEWFGFYAMIAGGVGGIIFGKLHDLYKHYKRLLILLFTANLGIFVWLSLLLAKTIHGTYVTAMMANVLGGLFMGAPQGIVYEGIVELTYPMPEQTGVSVFSILFNLWSLFFFVAGDWITPTMLNWMMCGSVAVTVLALGTIRESYPRSEVDAKHEGYDRIQ